MCLSYKSPKQNSLFILLFLIWNYCDSVMFAKTQEAESHQSTRETEMILPSTVYCVVITDLPKLPYLKWVLIFHIVTMLWSLLRSQSVKLN